MDIGLKRKRVSVKMKQPNPLFETWLNEWHVHAKEINSKMEHCFSLALKSLQKYPLPLATGKDCKILHGFGDKLCKMLDDKLAKHQKETATQPEPQLITDNKPKKAKKTKAQDVTIKEYIPQYRSGAYAILVTLFKNSTKPNSGIMTKAELIKQAQLLSDNSFTKRQPETWYTAWSSMKTLLEKNLVTKKGNPVKFSLTPEGTELADRLYVLHTVNEFEANKEEIQLDARINNIGAALNAQPEIQNKKKSSEDPTLETPPATGNSEESVALSPDSFDIILLVDLQEVNGKCSAETDALCVELRNLGVLFELRNLKVGDYTWICRDRNQTKIELVLPYIVERKRMDDLGASIKDGRFYEQKYRLTQCGLSNLIYLVENHGKNTHIGLPLNTLHQAATNTLVQDGFMVKYTEDLKGTCRYLSCLSKIITKLYRSKTVISCSKENIKDAIVDNDIIALMHFTEFNRSSSKNKQFTVKTMFVRQLLQIHGISVEKALGIVSQYPTPQLLRDAYCGTDLEKRESLLASCVYGQDNKKVGSGLSKIICSFFTNRLL